MARSLSTMFGFYNLTPGRRIYVLRRVRELAAANQLAAVITAVDAAVARDRAALELEAKRQQRANPVLVRDKDLVVDRILVAIDYLLGYEAGKSDGVASTRLQSLLFPGGVTHHTRLAFPEQSAANDRVLAILEGPAHSAQVEDLNLRRLTLDLRKARDAFEAALASRDSYSPTTWEEVKTARAAGQELYFQVIVQILAAYPNDPAARDTVLAPIWQQEDEVRAFRRQRRGPLLDVDPNSGELLEEPTEPTPAA